MQEYKVIGIMSGTSLDGVDLAYCYFSKDDADWKFEIRNAVTVGYSQEWKEKLSILHLKEAITFAKTNAEYGNFIGGLVKEFTDRNKLSVNFVSSHGHTIFHQPQNKFTSQIGDGAALSAASGFSVVCDFRSKDVALGGQGAPLVPIGDKILFSEYDFCLNLGGIANITSSVASPPAPLQEKRGEGIIAFDVCPCNLVLNYLSSQLGKEYDEDGKFARQGNVNESLLKQLNNLSYYTKSFPKSLGREDIEKDFLPLINSFDASTEDKLRTFCEHIATQISKVVVGSGQRPTANCQLLSTGGGTFNQFLISRIKQLTNAQLIIPDKKIINYKEALIFAFLGVLRWRGEVNCLKSVTGASMDNIGGAVYL